MDLVKKLISVVLAFLMLFSLTVSFSFTATDILSGFSKAETSSEKASATSAKASLNGVIIYYRNYYSRVTIPENLQKASVIAYKAELDILEALLKTDTLYLAEYYQTEGTGNIEALWQTFRRELPMSDGLIKMRDDYRDAVRPGLDFINDSSFYTDNSWSNLKTAIDHIDAIKNSCTDKEGLEAYNQYTSALDALEEKASSSVTTEQIKAKNRLIELMPYYRGYADRVTLEKYKANEIYQNYVNNILPRAEALISDPEYHSVVSYQAMENSLERAWVAWRLEMPLSAGLYVFRDKILETVGPQSQYDPKAWENFQNTLPAIHQMIDDTKNSLTATDAEGEQVLAILQQAVDGLNNPSTQTPEDIEAKATLASALEAYKIQLRRDTKEIKSPETETLNRMISSAAILVASTTATAEEYNKTLSEVETYLTTVFMPALFIGQPFIDAARAIYYDAARQWRSYTEDSWSYVSNAINNCDALKASGTDAQSAAAYSALQEAIKNLQPRNASIAELTVSSAEGSPGDILTIKINIGPDSGMIYGEFSIIYDVAELEFLSASDSHAQNYNGTVYFVYENPSPLFDEKNILTVTFKINDYAEGGVFPVYLKTGKLRDDGGYLITPNIKDGSISINSSFIPGNVTESGKLSTTDARKILIQALSQANTSEREKALADYNRDGIINTTDARKVLSAVVGIETVYTTVFDTQGSQDTITSIQGNFGSVVQIPETVPTKNGYIFKGWFTEPNGQGEKIKDTLIMTKDQTLYAFWEKFESGSLTKDEIQFGGYVAIHNAYATEEDFKMIAECGIKIIILDYTRSDKTRSDQCLAWCEKYGIKAYIHDYELNALPYFTKDLVLEYTSDYINNPSFAGNNLYDEPSNSQFASLQTYASIYKQALPGYDMHINLFPNYGATGLIGISYKTYLNQYISTITSCDHISQDPYPFSNLSGTKNVYSEYYQGLSDMAVIARDYDLDYWIYPQMLTGMNNYFPDLDDIRFQVYSGLAFGASKFMHYCYHVPGYNGTTYSAEVYAMRDYAGEYTELWDYAQYVHNEISVFSEEFSKYNWISASAYKSFAVPSYLSSISAFSDADLTIISSEQSLLIGTFESKAGTGKAFMITNAADPERRQSTEITFTAEGTVTVYLDGIKQTLKDINGVYTLNLKVAQGAFITIE